MRAVFRNAWEALEFYATGWLTNKFREHVTFWAWIVFYGLDTCGISATNSVLRERAVEDVDFTFFVSQFRSLTRNALWSLLEPSVLKGDDDRQRRSERKTL